MAAQTTMIQPGALVRARGRDWVVLPSADPEVIRLRPLTGGDEDGIGLYRPLEGHLVTPSRFPDPDPTRAGDAAGAALLRDAARLSLRDGAAPFRSLGRLAVTPRPYQFVPLIMALRQERVRLLIADDVGVGKTVEAGMIARELLDRGLAARLAVLCPAHLCEQWEQELREKFGIEAAVVQTSRIAKLQRDLPRSDQSIYQYYRHLVVSIDFVKSERNRGAFLHNAPDLLIVDEAHTAARPRDSGGRVQQQRFALLQDLMATPAEGGRERHLLLVTATPHSGIEESFQSLLGLLDPQFAAWAGDSEADRRRLLPYLVQRRRADLERWLGSTTPFPMREASEQTYSLAPAYTSLYQDVLDYCRETVRDPAGLGRQQQRVRHWAAIAMLRCLLSSPAAAVAVLSGRANRPAQDDLATFESTEELDAAYRPQVLDPLDDERAGDYAPTAPLEDADPHLSSGERRRLATFLHRAEALAGPQEDAKLTAAAQEVRRLLDAGCRPIIFCRFIATARYLAEWLPALLGQPDLRVAAVTGEMGDGQRSEQVAELARSPRRLLIATDCLSEGVNLQQYFDAVLHYDLPWNPNRLEQREGRVDRFGQPRPSVFTIVLYGANNEVDTVVLDVLIRKARLIRSRLGVSVPVPLEAEQVVQAVVDSVLLRRPVRALQMRLDLEVPQVSALHRSWDAAAEQERRQRAFFGQFGIQPAEVQRELAAADPVLGDASTVQRFLTNALQRFNGQLRATTTSDVYELVPGDLATTYQVAGETAFPRRVAFDQVTDTALVLGRTHPLVAATCDAILGRALAPEGDARFPRCGAIFTRAVQRRTIVALLRLRYLLRERAETFAEEVVLAAAERREGRLVWREPLEESARTLLEQAIPAANMAAGERGEQVSWALDLLRRPECLTPIIAARTERLQESHARLRRLVRAAALTVAPRTPPDLLGLYVLVPVGSEG